MPSELPEDRQPVRRSAMIAPGKTMTFHPFTLLVDIQSRSLALSAYREAESLESCG